MSFHSFYSVLHSHLNHRCGTNNCAKYSTKHVADKYLDCCEPDPEYVPPELSLPSSLVGACRWGHEHQQNENCHHYPIV